MYVFESEGAQAFGIINSVKRHCGASSTSETFHQMREQAEFRRGTRYYNMSSGEDGHGGPHEHDMMRQDDDDHF